MHSELLSPNLDNLLRELLMRGKCFILRWKERNEHAQQNVASLDARFTVLFSDCLPQATACLL